MELVRPLLTCCSEALHSCWPFIRVIRRHGSLSQTRTKWKLKTLPLQTDELEDAFDLSDPDIDQHLRDASYPWEDSHGRRCPIVLSVRFGSHDYCASSQAKIEGYEQGHGDSSDEAFFPAVRAEAALTMNDRFGNSYQESGGHVYYPNKFNKLFCVVQECGHWCRGQCREDVSAKPTNKDCWAASFRWHLAGGDGDRNRAPPIMLQVIEETGHLGPGQEEEIAMAKDLGIPIFLAQIGWRNGRQRIVFFKSEEQPQPFLTRRLKFQRFLLHWASRRGHSWLVRCLLASGLDGAQQIDDDGWAAAHVAAYHGHVAVLSELGSGKVDLCGRSNIGQTPVLVAAQCGCEPALHVLHRFGADLSVQDDCRRTAVHYAAFRGHLKVLHALYSYGVSLSAADDQGRTAAHCAAFHGCDFLLGELLAMKVDLNARDARGQTPAHWAAINGCKGVLEKLHNLQVDLKRPDSMGRAPVHFAAANGHVEVFEILKQAGTSLEVRDDLGQMPAHFAAKHGRQAVLKELHQRGARIDLSDRMGLRPFHLAAQHGHRPALAQLVEAAREIFANSDVLFFVMCGDCDGRTPAHLAAKCERAEILSFLYELKADLGVTDKKGFTPAHDAAANGHDQILRQLLHFGVDLNKKDHAGQSPLLRAVAGQLPRRQVLEVLAESGEGADLNEAAKMAHARGQRQVLQWLLELRADPAVCDPKQSPFHVAIHGHQAQGFVPAPADAT